MRKIYTLVLFMFVFASITVAQVANVEDLTLEANTFWNGADATGEFTSETFVFKNSFSTSEWGDFWNGFAYSNITDNTTEGFANQYSAITGKGHNSANYAVGYPYPTAKIELPGEEGLAPVGVFVTNNTYTTFSLMKGDAYAKKFGGETGNDPDWLLLTIKGLDKDGNETGKTEFYLADFRFDDNALDYIITDWVWVDLSALGNAKTVEFSLSSSDNGEYGMNTPGYFCIDDFNAAKPENEGLSIKKQLQDISITANVPVTINIDDIFLNTYDNAYILINTKIEAESGFYSVSFDGETNIVTVTMNDANSKTAKLTIEAYAYGQIISTTCNVSPIVSGIETDDSQITVYPNPVCDMLKITSNTEIVSKVEITDLAGKTVLSQTENTNFVNVASLQNGLYVCKLTFENGKSSIKKIVKK